MKTFILLLFPFFGVLYSFGQDDKVLEDVSISGRFTNLHRGQPIGQVAVTILREEDTLSVTTSDRNGEFRIEVQAYREDILEIRFVPEQFVYATDNGTFIKVFKDSIVDFQIEVKLDIPSEARPIMYMRDSIVPIVADLFLYKAMLDEHSEMVVSVNHTLHPDESEVLTQQRIINLEEMMKEMNFPMDRIQLDFSIKQRKCYEDFDCYAVSYFEIISLEGDNQNNMKNR